MFCLILLLNRPGNRVLNNIQAFHNQCLPMSRLLFSCRMIICADDGMDEAASGGRDSATKSVVNAVSFVTIVKPWQIDVRPSPYFRPTTWSRS